MATFETARRHARTVPRRRAADRLLLYILTLGAAAATGLYYGLSELIGR